MQSPELLEDPGFADLARAVDEEGLAAFASLPPDQPIHQLSLHGEPPSTRYALIIVRERNNKGVIMIIDAGIRRNYSMGVAPVRRKAEGAARREGYDSG